MVAIERKISFFSQEQQASKRGEKKKRKKEEGYLTPLPCSNYTYTIWSLSPSTKLAGLLAPGEQLAGDDEVDGGDGVGWGEVVSQSVSHQSRPP